MQSIMRDKTLNNNLNKAGVAKKDKFYTQLVDIEKELKHYKDQFRNKIVYCNCDDPYESNFFKFFVANFNAFGLKKLIATSYIDSPIVGLFQLDGITKNGKEPHKIVINEIFNINNNGVVSLEDVEQILKHDKNTATRLKGDGDFRSKECIGLLKEADIVVTNPPFSLFREYVAQLMEYNKKFLILGDQNAVTYKETFGYVKDNRLWLGYDNGGTKWFRVPIDYDILTESRKKIENGIKYFSMGRIVWYTNLDTIKRHADIVLHKKYSSEEFPKYDNYDVINVNKVADIPMDYEGIMGVPITFIDKYNPEQFEILGIANSARWIGYECITVIKSIRIYNRILIRNKRIK